MILKPSLGSLDVPQKIWARSVQPFCRLLDTNRQTDTKTDKPNLYIDRYITFLKSPIDTANSNMQKYFQNVKTKCVYKEN